LGGFRLEGLVPALMPPVLLGFARHMRTGVMPTA
jgi:hypothetical protein